MGQITRDGFTFNSDWIDASVARFKDKNTPWAARRDSFSREIAMREEDLKSMLRTMPTDLAGHAHSRAHLVALRKAEDDLIGEIYERRGTGDGPPKLPYEADGMWVVEYLHQGEVKRHTHQEESEALTDYSKLMRMFDQETGKYTSRVTYQGPIQSY